QHSMNIKQRSLLVKPKGKSQSYISPITIIQDPEYQESFSTSVVSLPDQFSRKCSKPHKEKRSDQGVFHTITKSRYYSRARASYLSSGNRPSCQPQPRSGKDSRWSSHKTFLQDPSSPPSN